MKVIYLFPQIGRVLKWKWLIPAYPSVDEFEKAWEIVFKHPLNECRIINVFSDNINNGFEIETPTGAIHHAGFGYHTDSPVLDKEDELFYTGAGCSWGRDKEGTRYYKLDKWSYMPVHWEEVLAKETIRNFSLKKNSRLIKTA